MSKFEKQAFDDIDVTKHELKEFEEALKKDEFRKILGEYFDEVNDPKNKALYEEEMTQLEKERGVDITFIHPNPGYVIKTSCDGERIAFINICSNEKVGRPIPTTTVRNGETGSTWSLPHLLIPPKIEIDKNQQRCIVFDVVFHPETIDLAQKIPEFRNFVNDTALSGVEDSFETKLDRNNLTYPKVNFVGSKTPSIVREKSKDTPNQEPLFDIPNYPYEPPKENMKPKVTRTHNNVTKGSIYTTPKYVIKHRKGVDLHECSNALDAKMNAATPTELIVEIDLPLLSSSQDATLDVSERSLSLISEKPSKYKLNISLPYSVDESNGTACFDKLSKLLIVTLPVIQKKIDERLFHRDDSGIESDANQNPCSSDEDLSKSPVEVMSSCDYGELKCGEEGIDFRTSEEVVTTFLSKDVHYVFPNYSLHNNDKYFSITVDVKNVDPSTVCHQYVFEGCGLHFRFSSLGAGFFPIHYAFCINFPNALINTSTLKVDVWDNNIVINLDLVSCKENKLGSYFTGLNVDTLQEIHLRNAVWFEGISLNNKVEEKRHEDISGEGHVNLLCQKVSEVNIHTDLTAPVNTAHQKTLQKARTRSESNVHPPPVVFARRSILKTSRSLSESNTDEYTTWSSLDSSDNQDESSGSSTKKTVRFSDVISKKVFRAGSSILGQRHKNEKKARNRKKVAIKRRRSESETSEVSETSDISDYSEVSDMSEASDGGSSDDGSAVQPPAPVPGSKRHRRRGSKNGRKNAATAKQNNFLLSHD